MATTSPWPLIHAEREAIAADLDTLTGEQWAARSLCAEWTVRDVLGHMIAVQSEEQMKKAGSIGPEFERMARMGRITPDLWMERATGRPVGPEALLEATQHALKAAR